MRPVSTENGQYCIPKMDYFCAYSADIISRFLIRKNENFVYKTSIIGTDFADDLKTFWENGCLRKVKKGSGSETERKRDKRDRNPDYQLENQKQKHHRRTNISAQASNAKRSERPGSLVSVNERA
jgi:hypothetical protein